MNRGLKCLTSALAVASVLSGPVLAAETRVVFVGCPIVRNTATPCWLGVNAGQLYFLGAQGDLTSSFYPPQFQHQMLVEGVVSSEPSVCGGVVLNRATVSVLPDLDSRCNIMLPAEGYADPPGGRVPGPAGVRGGAPPGPPPARLPPKPFAPPFGPRTFIVPFNADTDRLWGPAQQAISEALRYAAQVKAHQITVTGYRATIRLSDGSDFVESADVGERRARSIETAIRALGPPTKTQLATSWQDRALPSSGLGDDAPNRHAAVLVTP